MQLDSCFQRLLPFSMWVEWLSIAILVVFLYMWKKIMIFHYSKHLEGQMIWSQFWQWDNLLHHLFFGYNICIFSRSIDALVMPYVLLILWYFILKEMSLIKILVWFSIHFCALGTFWSYSWFRFRPWLYSINALRVSNSLSQSHTHTHIHTYILQPCLLSLCYNYLAPCWILF